jgi:DNA-binding MarR family transcriptional regulator
VWPPLALLSPEPVTRKIERETAELEAFEQALALAVERAGVAFKAQDGWIDRVRAGLTTLLELFDEQPTLARYLIVCSAQAGPAVLARRGEVLERLAALLDDERAPARTYPPLLTAHAVASGVLGVLYARLSQSEPGSLIGLAGSLMSFVVMPFLGARAARRELRHPSNTATPPAVGVEVVQDPGKRLSHHREIEVLAVLAGDPGLNNREVALRAGIKDRAHISRLMARLVRLGLVEDTSAPARPAGVKAWRLTHSGKKLHAEILREAAAPGPGAVLDVPEELTGHLDFWAVCLLRAVAEQPWLTSSELTARVGIDDQAQIARLLAQLADMRLIDSVRDAHRKGAPKVWQLTDRGRELDQAVGGKPPERSCSPALELMHECGGRLSDPAISALSVIAGERGLSNGGIAQRLGITDANSMSQVLARLTQRGLVENNRNGGRHNSWAITASGQKLANAVRQETNVAVAQSVAVDLLSERGGRLNHRVVSVLRVIGAEPGLSNLEIADRVGIASKAHSSKLLVRLERFGLIENLNPRPAPFEANAWRLTASGKQLETAVRCERQSAAPGASLSGQCLDLSAELW